jgi:hypothetical protein
MNIAEEVAATKIPCELKRNNKTVAVILPVPPIRKTKATQNKNQCKL